VDGEHRGRERGSCEGDQGLRFRARGREVTGEKGSYELKEPTAPYDVIWRHETADLRLQNEYLWKVIDTVST
jgi:hypothetical protein